MGSESCFIFWRGGGRRFSYFLHCVRWPGRKKNSVSGDCNFQRLLEAKFVFLMLPLVKTGFSIRLRAKL